MARTCVKGKGDSRVVKSSSKGRSSLRRVLARIQSNLLTVGKEIMKRSKKKKIGRRRMKRIKTSILESKERVESASTIVWCWLRCTWLVTPLMCSQLLEKVLYLAPFP